MTAGSSSSVSTRSAIAIALSPFELNAVHEPNASPGLICTLPTLTFKSLRGMAKLKVPSGWTFHCDLAHLRRASTQRSLRRRLRGREGSGANEDSDSELHKHRLVDMSST